jgi:hypothetical protein
MLKTVKFIFYKILTFSQDKLKKNALINIFISYEVKLIKILGLNFKI